jgi:hypothetical protein
MSTDETQPTRPPTPASPDPASQAPTEVHSAFEPTPPPAAQPSFQPARPRFVPGSTAQPAAESAYPRSVEPQTVRAESLRSAPAQAEQPPRPRFASGGAAQPVPPQADTPQYGKSPYGSEAYGSGAQYGETAQYSPAGRDRTAQYDTPQYGTAPYGQESGYDDQPPSLPAGRQPRPKRRRRRIIMAVFTVIVVLILLVIGDRVAKAVAENQIANQITSADSQIHPSVTIQGFPFLTQVITRDLKEIDISASNVPAGPVTISSVHAAAKGIHINGSFNGGEVDSISGTVFISFGSLSSALSSQSQGIADITLTSAGPHSINASFGVAGTDLLTETGTVTIKGNQVGVTWSQSNNNNSGILGSVLGNGTLPNLNFTLPKLPAGLQVKNFTVTTSGVSITVAAQHTTLSQ